MTRTPDGDSWKEE